VNTNGQSLLKLLFNTGELLCLSDSQFSYHSVDLDTALGDNVTLISPNADVLVRQVSTDSIILVALNPISGFRNDKNCYIFRNFLVELDNYERNLQIGYLKKLEIPYSAMVWSGSKSTHTVISLSEPLPDEKTYRLIYKWILNIVSLSDQALGNPSRSFRNAGVIRPETGLEQELIELKTRISHKELFAWLNKYEHLRPKAKEKKVVPPGQADFSRLSPWARIMLIKGIDFKDRGRNQTYYALAFDLAKAGFTEDVGTELLLERFVEERDFKEKELLTTIASAFKKVQEG
jgi:hypothetical protein